MCPCIFAGRRVSVKITIFLCAAEKKFDSILPVSVQKINPLKYMYILVSFRGGFCLLCKAQADLFLLFPVFVLR